MKVLGINGSPRKKNTLQVVQMIMDGITHPNIEKEIITLGEHRFRLCLGCLHCIDNYEGSYEATDYHCIQKDKDDVGLIKSKMMEADGIILGTPIYIMRESAHLKLVIDRLVDMAHMFPLAGKYFVVVSTIGLPPSRLPMAVEPAHTYLKYWMHELLGAYFTGEMTVSYYPELNSWPGQTEESVRKQAKELGQKLASDIIEKKRYPPSEKDLQTFKNLKQKVIYTGTEAFKKLGMPEAKEAEYWKRKGWLDKDFYI
jgi:multimeric flavodoxin WrbA